MSELYTIDRPKKWHIIFQNNGEPAFGELEIIDGELRFSGNADESAKFFFECVLKSMCDSYIQEQLSKKS